MSVWYKCSSGVHIKFIKLDLIADIQFRRIEAISVF